MNHIVNAIFVILSTVVASLWLSYSDYMLHNNKMRIKKRLLYLQPTIIMFILVIINFFKPILYTIDEFNVYSRLPLIAITFAMIVIMYIYVLISVYKNRKTISNKIVPGFLIILLLPFLASVLQLMFYGLLIAWPATSIALILSYIMIETTSRQTDYLTGAASRKKVEDFINLYIDKGKDFSVIMIDIDDFKLINDIYGHNQGDKALIALSSILHKVFNKNDIIARFGGDEFLIVSKTTNKEDIESYRNHISSLLKKNDNKHIRELSFSYGYVFREKSTSHTMDNIIIGADNKMYEDKAKNKNIK